ncbi:MAG: TIR domain-containing protein [Chloroflexota bacterium]|nr:TIR domain-containing protein [Chloroflexota bacterium]
MSTYWMICYSREQFYFAESLAVTLQRKKVQTWFDIQDIKPGDDWDKKITDAIAESAGLIVVVSKDSLISDNVKKEIQEAISHNKPIYLAIFEPIDTTQLPEALQNAPRVDFRGNFGRAAKRLVNAISKNEQVFDKWATLKGFPRLAPGIWGMIACIVLLAITNLIGGAFLAYSLHIYWFAMCVVVAIYSGYVVRQTLQRQATPVDFDRLFTSGTVIFIAALLLDLATQPSDISRGWSEGVASLILLINPLLHLVYRYLRGRGDFLRWMPRGEAPPRLRRSVNGYLKRRVKGEVSVQPMRYTVHYELADTKQAYRVIREMNRAGHTYLPFAVDGVDYRLVLISNQSNKETIRQLLLDKEKAIVILLSTVELHDELKHRQFVDYRRRERRQLRLLAEDLGTTSASVRKARGLYATPDKDDKIVMPTSAKYGLLTLRLMGASMVGQALVSLLTYVPQLGGDLAVIPLWWQLILVIITFIQAYVYFWLAKRVTMRGITLSNTNITVLVTLVAVPVSTNIVTAQLFWGDIGVAFNSFNIFQIVGFLLGYVLGVVFYIIFFSRGFGTWLPSSRLNQPHFETVSKPAPKAFRREYITASIIYTLVLFFLVLGMNLFGFDMLVDSNNVTPDNYEQETLAFRISPMAVALRDIPESYANRETLYREVNDFLEELGATEPIFGTTSRLSTNAWHTNFLFKHADLSQNVDTYVSSVAERLLGHIPSRRCENTLTYMDGFMVCRSEGLYKYGISQYRVYFVTFDSLDSMDYWLFMYEPPYVSPEQVQQREAFINSFCLRGSQDCPFENAMVTMTVSMSGDWNSDRQVYVLDTRTRQRWQLTSCGLNGNSSWSPDGSQIAYGSTCSGNGEIWLMNGDGTNQRQLTNSNSWEDQPSWSPDGQRLVYTRDGDIWVLNINSPANAQRVPGANTTDLEAYPSWRPDGQVIAFSARAGNAYWICEVMVNSTSTRECFIEQGTVDLAYFEARPTEEQMWWRGAFSWLAPGQGVVYRTIDPGISAGVYAYVAEDEQGSLMLDSQVNSWNSYPFLSSDLSTLFVTSGRGGPARIYRMRPDGTGAELLSDGPGHEWNPDFHEVP